MIIGELKNCPDCRNIKCTCPKQIGSMNNKPSTEWENQFVNMLLHILELVIDNKSVNEEVDDLIFFIHSLLQKEREKMVSRFRPVNACYNDEHHFVIDGVPNGNFRCMRCGIIQSKQHKCVDCGAIVDYQEAQCSSCRREI